MNASQLREALHAGRRVYGTCITSTSPAWPAMMARVGLDFVFLDTEHIPIDRAQLGWMCQAYAGNNLAPIVRIPKPDPYLACMALDGGACGIVAPYLESLSEVRELRGAVKFRPLKGARLAAALDDIDTLDIETREYLAQYNRDKLMIVNIESIRAMDMLDEIFAVPDIDAALIGPHDLSISLGIAEQYTHPRFTEAIKFIVDKARSNGISVGYHFSFGLDTAIHWAELGANFIIHSTDLFTVRDALQADLARFHTALGDAPASEAGAGDSGPVAV
jgi:4-hydroxy-2-oxoheptanedioate aldolase